MPKPDLDLKSSVPKLTDQAAVTPVDQAERLAQQQHHQAAEAEAEAAAATTVEPAEARVRDPEKPLRRGRTRDAAIRPNKTAYLRGKVRIVAS